MIWAAFSLRGATNVAILDGNQTAEDYCRVLNEYLIPFYRRCHRSNAIFQHYNATIHTAYVTRNLLQNLRIDTMDWPARSPDLNPIENLWGILARAVYANGRQYFSRNDLIDSIYQEWGKIRQQVRENLIHSMNSRCRQVIDARGSKTKY
jgi:hypothetical protein